MTKELAENIDPVLKQYITAANEIQATLEMGRIEKELTPFIHNTVKFQFERRGILRGTTMTVDDVVSEIWVRILPRLREMRSNPSKIYLCNLRSYAFKMVRNYCYDFRLYTERERRYFTGLRTDCEAIQIKTISERSCYMERTTEMRVTIEKLWCEILQLNMEQRTVIIMDILRENEFLLLVALGVASLNTIAEVTELPDSVITQFYNDSPCDCEIARLLNCSKQRVVNLRSSARKRLNRRMQELI